MSRHAKLIAWASVLGLLPFVVFVGTTSRVVENGVVVDYGYFNLAALVAGIAVVCIAVALARRDPEHGLRPPKWMLPVCAVLVLLGAFQVVRGAGLLPGITGCTSDTGTAGLCTPLNVDR